MGTVAPQTKILGNSAPSRFSAGNIAGAKVSILCEAFNKTAVPNVTRGGPGWAEYLPGYALSQIEYGHSGHCANELRK